MLTPLLKEFKLSVNRKLRELQQRKTIQQKEYLALGGAQDTQSGVKIHRKHMTAASVYPQREQRVHILLWTSWNSKYEKLVWWVNSLYSASIYGAIRCPPRLVSRVQVISSSCSLRVHAQWKDLTFFNGYHQIYEPGTENFTIKDQQP